MELKIEKRTDCKVRYNVPDFVQTRISRTMLVSFDDTAKRKQEVGTDDGKHF